MKTLAEWKNFIGQPSNCNFKKTIEHIKTYNCADFDCEIYMQSNGVRANGDITYQRVMKV